MPRLACIEPSADQRRQLLGIARRSIARGGDSAPGLSEVAGDLPEPLSTPAAVFVTLLQTGDLRGCIGSLEARHPLALAVARAAHGAAYGDRRFAPLAARELDSIVIEISILSPLEPLAVSSRSELRQRLRPGIDGLLLEDGSHRSTFLPQVWEKMADADEFVEQLLIKAGLPSAHWSDGLRLHRYQTHSFGEKA